MRPEDAPGDSAVQAGAIPNQRSNSKWRDIIIVLLVAWAAPACYAFYIMMVFGLGACAKYIQQQSAPSADSNSNQLDHATPP
ncbi:MAG TPA: hypothetical protein VMF08_08735 [Candidatus Sulfotelmatobacter sp.]|nr:hypothetical protein [Candidatus Sulfotelmatobacter sp.]